MFGRHWRGESPLIIAILGFGVLGSLLIVALGRLTLAASHVFNASLAIQAAIDLIWLAFCIILWVWVVVGIWRSASHATRHAKWIARAVVVAASLVLVPTAVASSEAAVELAHLVRGRDPMGEPVRLTLIDDRILLEGTLAQGSGDAFERAIKQSPVSTIRLNSPGGRIGEAEQIAEIVKTHALDTEVEELCASACTLILLAGRHRTAFPKARVGFHQSTFAGNGSADDDLETEAVRARFREAGVDDGFIRKAFSTSATSMWYPTEKEMLSAGVLNRRGIEVLLRRVADGVNRTLPRRIDQATTLRSVDTKNHVLTYHYDVALAGIDEVYFRKEMNNKLVEQSCANKGLRALIDSGAEFAFDYVSTTGKQLPVIKVDACTSRLAKS